MYVVNKIFTFATCQTNLTLDKYMNEILAKGFKRGLGNLKAKDLQAAKTEIKGILEINTRESLRLYASGKITPTKIESDAIRAVFAKYGLTRDEDIWGTE